MSGPPGPDHLVSVRSDQPGAALSTATMHTATTGTGDTFTPVDTAATTVMYGLVNTGRPVAAIDSNSARRVRPTPAPSRSRTPVSPSHRQ
ncbi:hypothetical protein ACFCYI_03845 [Streptomyces sp. NPDC056257]|uniref:hypothetical protein n=1 Tax=Streptomyces sp. NPDC056257 TaxID=3345765 RepID=UPI0035DE6858